MVFLPLLPSFLTLRYLPPFHDQNKKLWNLKLYLWKYDGSPKLWHDNNKEPVDEGKCRDEGDEDEPEPEEDVDLLVDDVQRLDGEDQYCKTFLAITDINKIIL